MSAALWLSPRRTLAWCGLICTLCAGYGTVCAQGSPDQDIAAVRKATAPFHDVGAAQKAGYTTVVGDPTDGHTCLEDMGIHYLNTSLVDDTVVVTRPEIMIFEPQRNGSLKFVGVEYIIPYTIHPASQNPPVLFGVKFTRNETFKLWALHVWIGRRNPTGEFATYNPAVSCKFAK